MSQLSLLLKNFRLEAKAKLNTDELFFLEYPNELDLGLYVRLMPYTLKDKDQLNALEALPLSQQIKESSLAIHNKLDSINESLAKLLAQPQSTAQLCSQLPSSMTAKGSAGYSLYQQLRFVESNMILSQQNKLKLSALFLQSLLGYFDLFTLMYFLHKSKFRAEQLVLNHPLFAGMDDGKKERLQLFATLLSDYKAGMERMQAIAEFANILCSLKDEGACYGFALYGLDPSLDALNALQRLNPSKTTTQLMQELSTTLSNQLQPALVTFDDFCNSAAFLRQQVNALQTATRPLRRNKDPLTLTLRMPRRDKAADPTATAAAAASLDVTAPAPEPKAKKSPRGLTQKSGQDQILGVTLGTPEQTQAAQKALFATPVDDSKISTTKKKTRTRKTNSIPSGAKGLSARHESLTSTAPAPATPVAPLAPTAPAAPATTATPTASAAHAAPTTPVASPASATSAVATTANTTAAATASKGAAAPFQAAVAANTKPAKPAKPTGTIANQNAATALSTQRELPPIDIDAEAEQQSSAAEIAAMNKRQRVHDYTRPSMEVKYMRASDALKNAEEQMQAQQKIRTQIVGNNAIPVLSATPDAAATSSWQRPQSEVGEYVGLLQILDTSPELMRLKYCLLFAQYYLLPESDFVQLLHTIDPELLNEMESPTNSNANGDGDGDDIGEGNGDAENEAETGAEAAAGTETAHDASQLADAAITTDASGRTVSKTKSKIEPPASIGDLSSGSDQILQEIIQDTWHSPESQLLHSLLARKLRSPKELQTMHQVLLEMASSSTEQQRTLSLQAAKFNYYAKILGRDFTVLPNSQRTPDSERHLLKTNIKNYNRDPLVQFLLATLILSAYNLYYKVNRNGLFETYQHLQLRSPL